MKKIEGHFIEFQYTDVLVIHKMLLLFQ